MSETFNTRHTLTGRLQRLTAGQIKPFEKVLEIVPDDAKPLEPGLFKPGTVGEFKNPEPPTDSVVAAQAAYDAVLVDNAPNSKVARAAKETLDAAIADAEAARIEAESSFEEAQDETAAGESTETPEGADQ